ncbi:inorganic phosphate transporter [Shumkonia mesophila]|uniref:inorganic phosphate transporter n=1 Tax=Shumkonia mesophila TaxID=2838854 RepID=UPI002934B6DD|nr:anion permease [Shumkonia mesophila]
MRRAAGTEGHVAVRLGLAGAFLLAVLAFTAVVAGGFGGTAAAIVGAGVVGGYMALNIGANDVANNMGPAVGARAVTMAGALVIAAVFETAGAVLAGGDVVATIAKGIVDPVAMADAGVFVVAMMAALLAAALWLNLATYIGAPVSTTHAIVGGVMGAGIAASGMAAVNWPTMGAIAASWVISPLMGGAVAALFLSLIRHTIVFQEDRIAASRRWVPVLIGVMASTFGAYVLLKGLGQVWKPSAGTVAGAAVGLFVTGWLVARPLIARQSAGLENRKKAVHGLFSVPLICAAALLSFAHGANDVANAVGPLAAIVYALSAGGVAAEVGIPYWVLIVGALGISVGLALFGPRLIRTVGEKITKLNPIRAFCVALSAAITVLIASALGLPVSSTHIAVGGVFGVGFLREILHNRLRRRMAREAAAKAPPAAATEKAPDGDAAAPAKKKKKKKLKLVRRKHLGTIVAAWVVTVPLAAALAALLFFLLAWGRAALL